MGVHLRRRRPMLERSSTVRVPDVQGPVVAMSRGALHVCRFDTAEHLTGKRRTYAAVKEAVLAAGRFSAFEASANAKSAAIFTRLCRDPDVETFDLGFPWTGVRRKAAP